MSFLHPLCASARYLLCALIATAMLPVAAPAQVFKTETGRAEFDSDVPLHSFTGTSDHLAGQIDLANNSVDFYLDLSTLKTGIGKRDRDMLKTLETDTYPFAEFFGTLISDFDPQSTAVQPATVRGDFTVHGITRQVEVTGSLQNTPGGLHLKAAWQLDLDDYDISPPRLLFVKVAPIQDLRIDALLAPAADTTASK